MNSMLSVVHAWKTSGATETIDPAPAHVDARNIAVDFYLEGRRHRVLQDINLAVPKGSLISESGCSGARPRNAEAGWSRSFGA